MAELKEIECKGCGIMFMQTNHSQRYCESCREGGHPEKMAREIERAFARNMATYYDVDIEMRETQCVFCGKAFQYPARRGKERAVPEFCSQKCISDKRISETMCANCGKPMLETEDIYDTYGHAWCCSPECKEERKWAAARQNGLVKTCPVCGKEFIKNTTYCSRECYLKVGWKKKDPEPCQEPETYQVPCLSCGKITLMKGEPGPGTPVLCHACRKESPKKIRPCAGQTKKMVVQKKAPQKKTPPDTRSLAERRREMKEKQRAAKALREELEYIRKNGLCGVCKTPYTDCERMQTQFRIMPKGAQYIDSKIAICPKFATSTLKHIDIQKLRGE